MQADEEEIHIPLSSITIADTIIPLFIDLVINKFRVHASVSLPKNYPDTTNLKREFHNKPIFDLIFAAVTINKNPLQRKMIDNSGVNEDALDEKYIYINQIYFRPKEFNIPMTSEEETQFRGIGRKVICKVFEVVVPLFSLNPNRTLVFLTAEGTINNKERHDAKEAELISMSPSLVRKLKLSHNLSADVSIKNLLAAEENIQLATYYHRIFGFKIIDQKDPYSILMCTFLNVIT